MTTALSFAIQQIRIIAPFAQGYAWAIPVMAAASICASLLETLSISVVILFLYATIGPGAEAAEPGGLLSRIFDAVAITAGDSSVWIAALILGLVATKSVLSLGYNLLTAKIKHVISERARNEIYSQYLRISYGRMRSCDQGTLFNTLANESWAVSDAFYSFARIGTNLAAFVVFGAILLAISWQITVIALIGSGVLFWSLRILASRVRDLGQVARDANRELAGQMSNTLHALRTIRAYGLERFRQQVFDKISHRARTTLVRMEQVQSLLSPISEISYLLLLAVIAWASIILDIPFAATLSAVALLYRLRPHMREFEGNRLALARLAASLADVHSVVMRPDDSYPPAGSQIFTGLKEEIRFQRVSLRYPAAASTSLKSVSFPIRQGATTAIIGPSGSGKTTIVNLLLRLYEPSDGSILVDATPLDRLTRSSWLRRVAVAGQDADLIDDTVIENIRLARPDADMPEIERAARLAGIYDFIVALPDGFDSWIGEYGLNISGGQRQRIGIARALVRQPELLILDEATNALEKSLEEQIHANVLSVMAGGTTIIITQRLDALRNVDHVVCLEHGKVRAQGPADTVFGRGEIPSERLEI